MVGKKTRNISKTKIPTTIDNNNINSEYILDLDELHMNVTPPSELNENYSLTYEIGKLYFIQK